MKTLKKEEMLKKDQVRGCMLKSARCHAEVCLVV